MNKLTVDDVLTSSGRYMSRKDSPELTDELKANAAHLCDQVNGLLAELGITKKQSVTSGFRTSAANDCTSNAGKTSSHLKCMAVDLLDGQDQALALLVMSREDLLKKYGLYMEHPTKTIGKVTCWCHLSTRAPGSGKHIFMP